MRVEISQISVLLIEPSSAQNRIISNYLAEIGVTDITWVRTGKEGIERLGLLLPHLVISAMHLEDMTGTELVQNLRMDTDFQAVPFMLISSETSYRYLEPIRQAGVIAIVPKPFTLLQLKQAMSSTLDYLNPDELVTDNFYPDELKVLVVDDSFTARRHIIRVLNNMGIENITQAQNGKEAMEIIADNYFDLLVTDYNMPQMDGKELVEHVRQHSNQSAMPILMVSSEDDESRIASVQQAGISALCDKPFESATVKQIIAQIIV